MTDPDRDTRPGLAFVVNAVTPYGVHLQRSIAAGIPEFKLHVLVTHSASDFQWQIAVPPELHLTRYGAPGEHPLENPLRRPVWGWRKGGKMIRYVRDNNVRAVIISGYRYISFLRLMNHCYQADIPFFVTNDSNIRSQPRLGPLQRFIKSRLYAWWMRRASGVMSMGKLGDQFFLKYGADPHRLYRVPCWPDFSVFARCDEVALNAFRRKFGLDSQRRYLLFSGRLIRLKRVDLLMEAFRAVAVRHPQWDLIIAGDGIERDDLKRRVPQELRSRVIWTGFLDGQDSALVYHAADVLILPSDYEAWALVVQEAMAAGLPVIASDVVGAAHELVTDGLSGRIFPAGDGGKLQEAIEEVIAPDRLESYRQQAGIAFERYCQENNPIAEIRRALADVQLLSHGPVV